MPAPITIPDAQEIREQIQARVEEVRALKQMLKLAAAARAAENARGRQRPLSADGREGMDDA
jgi:hypothetical protein